MHCEIFVEVGISASIRLGRLVFDFVIPHFDLLCKFSISSSGDKYISV